MKDRIYLLCLLHSTILDGESHVYQMLQLFLFHSSISANIVVVVLAVKEMHFLQPVTTTTRDTSMPHFAF